MESHTFLGSPVFITMVLVGVVAAGFILRLAFHSGNGEYKHKSDD